MMKRLGIVGCGDFLRWQAPALAESRETFVSKVFDLDPKRARRWAEHFGCEVCASAEELATHPEVDIVLLYVPPWARAEQVRRAAEAGKPILTTKPLAPSLEECEAILAATKNVPCGVIYNRTQNGEIETLKSVFDAGCYGRLALYKQDWIHHFPQWNDWATDPRRNGGPFMDAMIHNLNIARYLMGRPIVGRTFASDNHAQALPCPDTQCMKLDFEGGGSAHLFITWAADLAVFGTEGNDREHIEQLFMVTDQGWHVGKGSNPCRAPVGGDPTPGGWVLRRLGETAFLPAQPSPNVFDQFVAHLAGCEPWPPSLVSVREAAEDIALVLGEASGSVTQGT